MNETTQMPAKKRRSIKTGVLQSIMVFALLSVIAVSAAVCYGLGLLSDYHFKEDALDRAETAARAINGDRIAGYLETGEKDEFYEETDSFLRALANDFELTRADVFVPGKDDVVFLWDADVGGGSYDLGDRVAYSEDKSQILDAFNGKRDSVLIENNTPEGRFITVYYPVRDSNGNNVALAGFEQERLDIANIIMQFILVIIATTVMISSIMLIGVYSLFDNRVAEPIRKLTEGAGKIVGNMNEDEAISIDVHTNNELETLAEAFVRMDMDMRAYVNKLSRITAEKERIDTELDIASQIQMSFLPKLEPPFTDDERFELYGSMKPAREVGGDFYDFFMADDRHLVLTIGDVSGKGMPAAMFMVVIKIMLRNAFENTLSPGEALRNVNSRLIDGNDLDFFTTAWVGVIDLETGEGVSVNAGHEHPALGKKGGIFQLEKYMHSPPLAAFDDSEFTERSFTLDRGDTLFVYTDGATEACDDKHHLFGEDRLVISLNKHRDALPRELIQGIKTDISTFVGSEPQFDDLTMLAFRYEGKR